MCGYVVVDTKNLLSLKILRQMQNNISHRGNDDSGIVYLDDFNSLKDSNNEDDTISFYKGFAFQRLSIQDLSISGHQPMIDKENRFVIVFNGEIFNFKELRLDLIHQGYTFASNTDTEVILQLYKIHGVKMLRFLNGMFSFVIYDKLKDEYFIARDRMGIKPLYYYLKDNNFFIASEIKAFLPHPKFTFRANTKKIDEYMMFGYLAGEETMHNNVKQCMPGHFMIYKNNQLFISEYWNSSKKQKYKKNFNFLDQFKILMKSSINYQLISDVEVGGQLSGGIDSSLIASFASKNNTYFKNTFSVIFEDDKINEEKYIDFINTKLNLSENKFLMNADDIISNLEKTTWHFDNPLSQPNSIGIYLLAKEAKKYLKVLLSGEGADEVFGGYDRHYPARILSTFPLLFSTFNNLRSSKMQRDGNSTDSILICLSAKSLKKDIRSIMPEFNFDKAISVRKKIFKDEKDFLKYDQFLSYEQKTYLNELLIRQDKMCMAHGVENRVPFLDHRIVEFSKKISLKEKTSLGFKALLNGSNYSTKKILKDLSKDNFGKEFTYRDKLGFNMPLQEIISNKRYKDYFISLIEQVNLLDGINIDINIIKDISSYPSNLMWTIISLGAWLKVFKN